MASLRRTVLSGISRFIKSPAAAPSSNGVVRCQTIYRTSVGGVFGNRFYSSSTRQQTVDLKDFDLNDQESKRQLVNRLTYRSKQRGFLELDLVLGTWVENHIGSLDEKGIRDLVNVLNLENPDLWKWLTGQEQPPEGIDTNPVFIEVRSKVMNNLDNFASPQTRATPGQPWVRGWDDFKKGRDSPNQQQRSHIPKFGSWDADNVPYTAYFENARKDKGSGVMINPNDPEQNPQAFMAYGGGSDDVSNNNIVLDEQNMKHNKGSNSDFSIMQQNYKSDRRKSSNSRERISNFSPPSPSPGPNRPRYGYKRADDIPSHRSTSVPMFGAWDEKDPKSGDGFTVIFQKVKEEKHIAATKFPPIPQQPSYNSNISKNDTTSTKKWCCLF